MVSIQFQFSNKSQIQISRKNGAIAFTSHSITDYTGRKMVHFLYRNPDAESRRHGTVFNDKSILCKDAAIQNLTEQCVNVLKHSKTIRFKCQKDLLKNLPMAVDVRRDNMS
jgi:hypothetical protein